MKSIAFLFAFLALAPLPLSAESTAYQALDYLTERKGEKMLEGVYLIRGNCGTPQPDQWLLYRGRRNATAFQVTAVQSSGKISTGAAPVRAQGVPTDAVPLNLSILNVDTPAACSIAKRHARRENFTFNRIDYQLNTHPLALVPAWTLYLYDESRSTLGIITLSATTGEVLNRLKLYRYSLDTTASTKVLVTRREPWDHRAARSIKRWFSQTGKNAEHDLLNTAGTTEELLLGRRTRHFSEDAH